jgi:hypothetical protein
MPLQANGTPTVNSAVNSVTETIVQQTVTSGTINSITLQTNGVNNPIQNTLNLSGVNVSYTGSGAVEFLDTNVGINGGPNIPTLNFNASSPSPDSNNQALVFKFSGTNAIVEVPVLTASGVGHQAGIAPDPGASAGTTRFLREDATFAVPSGTGTAVEVNGGGTLSSLNLNSSSPSADSNNQALVVKISGANAITEAPLMTASGVGHQGGLTPDPGSSAGTTRFLREDATFAVPSGSATGIAAFYYVLISHDTVASTPGTQYNITDASIVVTFPSSGGPWRVIGSYATYANMTGQISNMWIYDGTHTFASVENQGASSACDLSPATYADSATVTFVVQVVANGGYTIKFQPHNTGSTGPTDAFFKIAVVPSA